MEESVAVCRRPRVRFGWTVPKNETTANEDRWHKLYGGSVCAVSDGASVSFDPGPWAEILVREYVVHPRTINSAWITQAVDRYRSAYDRDTMPWMMQAAFDRGSFASLLGVHCSSDGREAHVFALGDSMAVVADGGAVKMTFPYEKPEEFDRSPILLGTRHAANADFTNETLSNKARSIDIVDMSELNILLMTDALGRWFLEHDGNDAVFTLLNLSNRARFVGFVETERANGRMRRDDTTLIVMGRYS